MIEIINFKLVNGTSALKASFDVVMLKWHGFVFEGCTYFESGDKKWVNLPGTQYESEGKKKFKSCGRFQNQETNDKFRMALLKEALDAREKYLIAVNSQPSKPEAIQGEFPF
jgi:hypothetical protein